MKKCFAVLLALAVSFVLGLGQAVAGQSVTPGRDAANQAEPPRPAFVPSGFVFGFHNKKTDENGTSVVLLEYVPKGETVGNWSEMITVVFSVFQGTQPALPAAQAELAAEEFRKVCPEATAEVVRYAEQAGSPAGVRASCPKSPVSGKPEAVFMKYDLYGAPEQGKFVVANVQRATSGAKPKLDMDALQKWVEQPKDFNPK